MYFDELSIWLHKTFVAVTCVFKQIFISCLIFCRFGVRGEDFMFTLAYIIENMEEDKDIFEWQYQILFDKFIQMFGIISM